MVVTARRTKKLRPVRPNEGTAALYRQRMRKLLDEMHRSVVYHLSAAYRATPPEMAQDATPAVQLQREMNRLTAYWLKRMGDAAPRLAKWFAQDVLTRSDKTLAKILKDGGFSVKFTMTRPMRDIFLATVDGNINLIKTIPQTYLGQVKGAVMRSVQTGRDLQEVVKEIDKLHVVSRRRAALIALDQNNKATSAMQRARQLELGLTEGVWIHSHGGREPRKTHLENDGKRFSIADGWFDPDPKVRKRIWPGELINCRCVWGPVIPGLS